MFVPPQFHSSCHVRERDVVFCALPGWERGFTCATIWMHGFGGGAAAQDDASGEHDCRGDEGRLRVSTQDAARILSHMKPVTIVGAGPVGLTTALSLAQQGIPVQVIEQEPALTMDQRAGSYHPPTLEMLAPFGVTDEMHRHGIKVPRWQIRDRREGVIVE